MKRILNGILLAIAVLAAFSIFGQKDSPSLSTHNKVAWYEMQPQVFRTTFQADYVSDDGEIEDPDIQCPIPMEDRVRNHTGTQCVFSSIEMLGRWAEEPKLMNPPITNNPSYQSYSEPSHAAKQLRRLGVKFEQTDGDREAGIALIKKAMEEGRGCLFDVPGHAMVLVHYDEENDVVKWVDNSDRTLKIQTMTIARFKQRWGSWILVVYADNDIIADKLGRNNYWQNFPIVDPQQPSKQFDPSHIPLPTSSIEKYLPMP